MSYTISKTFDFSASHRLEGLSDDHPCSRLHGHNYRVKLELTGPATGPGFVKDYRDLAPFKKWLDECLDHRHLNDLMQANPTAEHLARWLAYVAHSVIGAEDTLERLAVSVSETPKTWATFTLDLPASPEALDAERYRWGGERA